MGVIAEAPPPTKKIKKKIKKIYIKYIRVNEHAE
jgi:hypothetical protein